MSNDCPRVGTGVIILKDDKILVGKRKGSHAPYYSIPGGKLDLGETFENTAIREIKEETNLDLKNPKVIAINNDLATYKESGKHFVSVIMLVTEFSGEPKVMEPNKCEEWLWVDPNDLPQPHFEASSKAVRCYLENTFYLPNQ